MSNPDFSLEKFLEIEKRYKLNEKTIDGAYYWTYGRYELWTNCICASKLQMGKSQDNSWFTMRKLMQVIKNSLLPFRGKIVNTEKGVLFQNHPRRVLNNGVYECIYTDALAVCFDNKAVIEYSNRS